MVQKINRLYCISFYESHPLFVSADTEGEVQDYVRALQKETRDIRAVYQVGSDCKKRRISIVQPNIY